MNIFDTQIAVFAYPFLSKIFEKELNEQNIEFRSEFMNSYEGGIDSEIFYVKSKDSQKAFIIKEKVDVENAISEVKYIHPLKKIFAYIMLSVIIVYIISKLVE